ncbi:LysE/ArgO family amino acid transporter [Haematomicrobium sanguinis]|uniref:LysE/ArgO family amino acid transporter n=1 Tax=Haematomicrobium sanguinis TaxID=479106 RepID=UPI00047C9B83|nr:LysE/ArgO family amino acid transporter [Haematomicrobium sanguinis]
MEVFSAVFSGLASGLALIIAIGAQNAFVLRTGIARKHVLAVVAVCALSDVVLIFAGVAGLGALITTAPWIIEVARYGGAAFLVGYACLAFRRMWKPQMLNVAAGSAGPPQPRASVWGAVATALALTWLNPHVYLDTVLLLGSLAAQHGDPGRWLFMVGAQAASVMWFVALGFGARFLAPVFAKKRAWQVLDALIGMLMVYIALSLLTAKIG